MGSDLENSTFWCMASDFGRIPIMGGVRFWIDRSDQLKLQDKYNQNKTGRVRLKQPGRVRLEQNNQMW